MKLSPILVGVGLALFAAGLPAQADRVLKRSHLGKTLPKLSAEDGAWFNSPQPLSLDNPRGQATLLVYTVLW